MAAMYKLDDGQCYPTNCFPAKSLLQPRYKEGAGHWQVARHNMEKTKIEWLFGSRGAQQEWQVYLQRAQSPRAEKILNKAKLMKLHHVQHPSDLCSVNISHQNFAFARESDFMQFDSVAYVNATENLLTLEIFRSFPSLRELELSLNGLRNLKVRVGDFPHLEILDLSYNNLSPEDVGTLGILPHLKALHLTANGLSRLPLDLAASECNSSPKFRALEVLLLDDNHFSDSSIFLSLANLQRLKQLNLDKNGIREVPYLHHVSSDHFSIHPLSAKSGIRAGLRCRKNVPKKQSKNQSPRLSQQYSYIIAQNIQDPDKTEVVFQTAPPAETAKERPPSPPENSKEPCPTNLFPEFLLPLPELRFLSLAHNQIEHEEDLLAVAFFPSLTELTFYGNPFTTSRSGDPPLLTSFLQNKLGIKLVRKKVSKLGKPHVFIPIKANREIKSSLPKIRKHPPAVETILETTFWQLWTAADLDPNQKAGAEFVPESRSLSLSYDPDQPIIPPLKPEERSACISSSSLGNEPYSLGSSFERTSYVSDLLYESSVDQILAGKVPGSPHPLGQMSPEALPQSASASQGKAPSGLPTMSRSLSASQHNVSELPTPSEKVSESLPCSRTASRELSPEGHLDPVAPPNSPSEERLRSEEEKPASVLSAASGGEPIHSSSHTMSLRERKGSERLVSSEHVRGEEDVVSSPINSFSVEQDLPSSPEDQESMVPTYPSGESLGVLPEVVLLTISSEEDEDQEEPSPLLASFEDLNLLESSEEKESTEALSSPLLQDDQTLVDGRPVRKSSQPLVPPSRSVSGELYKLFSQVQAFALSPEPEEDISTTKEMLTSSTEGVTEPIFITQVDESLDSRGRQLSPGQATPSLLEKFSGYEELLGGDPGTDFVEPKGIQQNVQALEKALRYPLVYREPKAKLDRCQKPYVPAKKKVLRVPKPKPQKTRMERLEEILLELRKPNNLTHIPLVCVLRRRKENWREYREALDLLKEFQQDYKSMVTVCNKVSESRAVVKDHVPRADLKPILKLQSLLQIQSKRRLDNPSVRLLQEEADSIPPHQ